MPSHLYIREKVLYTYVCVCVRVCRGKREDREIERAIIVGTRFMGMGMGAIYLLATSKVYINERFKPIEKC